MWPEAGTSSPEAVRKTAMTLQIGTTSPNFEAETTEVALGARTHNVSAPKELLQVIARSTACSSIVFSGLLAWASLNAHLQPEPVPPET